MEEGTSVMRALSLVLPRDVDDGDDEEALSLPESAALQVADVVMQASCSVCTPHHK